MTGRVVTSVEVSERFLWDLRQTVLELIAENHAGHLAELAHDHGLGLSIEPYDGTPCDDMTYGSRADVPMGEFWTDTFTLLVLLHGGHFGCPYPGQADRPGRGVHLRRRRALAGAPGLAQGTGRLGLL